MNLKYVLKATIDQHTSPIHASNPAPKGKKKILAAPYLPAIKVKDR